MSSDLAMHAIAEVMALNSSKVATKVYWHGAEPLLAGIDFFRRMFEWTRETYGVDSVQHHIQTNGTMLNDAWFDLFVQEHVTVGVSLDGPQALHDTSRVYVNGEGSFERVFRNIMAARKRKLFFDVLCVISRNTMEHVDELFDFFYENSIDFGFEPLTPETKWMAENLAITPDEYAETVMRIFDRWYFQSERRLRMVVPPYHYLMALMTGANTFCHFSENCARHYLAVDPSGEVFGCIMYARHPELSFGNIKHDSLDIILESSVRRRFLEERADVASACKDCGWHSVCHGGCPHHAFARYGTTDRRDPLCPAYKRIFAHIAATLAATLDRDPEMPVSQTANLSRTASGLMVQNSRLPSQATEVV